jgi:hypothetical protein
MKILENHTVRHLRLVLNSDERDRYKLAMVNFIERDIYAYVRRSGPNIGSDYTVIPNEFLIILDVQEDYADEFLNRIKNGDKNGQI